MIELSAQKERTYGLVIGIESYQENSWNVKGGGPAHDAIQFAQWLLDCGVPKENIRLCLSSLENVEHPELARAEATEQQISALITDWLSDKKGDLLYLFWAGHGLITSERNRRLLCADATKRNWQNLDLDSLLVYLSSEAFLIKHHICIIDACANYILESKGRPTNLGGKTFPSGQPRKESQQFVLLATREGEQAKVSAEGQTGYFSQAVREALTEEFNGRWPPDMEAISQNVKQRFSALDKKQLPTYFYRRSWDGDTDIYHPNPFEIPHNIRNSTARKFVGRDDKLEHLHQLLQNNPVVAITDVTGQGGVGKTELAAQYSWRYLEDYPGGCCWLNPQGTELATQLVEFGVVNFPNFNCPKELSLESQLLYCWRNWQKGSVLLVFDDVKDFQQIQPYLPSFGPRFKVLITTRRLDLPLPALPLGGLPLDAALELLAKLLGNEQVKQELKSAQDICETLQCVPLALETFAGLARAYNPALRRVSC
ncbi:MAG TPA: NB-ARC domain-containing protein [Stenomitos sp.]